VPRLMRVRTVLVLPFLATTLLAQVSRPLPEHEPFVRATRDNLIRSQRAQFNYSYKERRTEFHVNPFGRVGTGGIEGWEVTPIENGAVILRKLIERDGKPVTDGEVDRIKVKEERRREGRRTTMDDVVAMLNFKIARREVVNGRDAIVITFTPRPDGEPDRCLLCEISGERSPHDRKIDLVFRDGIDQPRRRIRLAIRAVQTVAPDLAGQSLGGQQVPGWRIVIPHHVYSDAEVS